MMNMFWHSKWFEALYRVSVAVKGFDGAIELIAGLALLLSPGMVHMVLSSLVGQASHHHGHTFHFIAVYIGRLDSDLARSGITFLIIFLIGHGVVKLALVYCLIKRIVRAYPYAIAILVGFLVYQLYAVYKDPSSIGLWLFTALDIAIIAIVWGEYKDLREKHAILHIDAKDTAVL